MLDMSQNKINVLSESKAIIGAQIKNCWLMTATKKLEKLLKTMLPA